MSVRRLSRAVLVIAGRVEQFFTNQGIFLRRPPYGDVVLAALLRSSCQTARAIVSLARNGYGSNALGHSRSIVETWITVRWITNKDTDVRASKFQGFNSKQRERIMALISTYYPEADLSRHKGNKYHDRKAAEYSKWDSWGERLRKMAEEKEEVDDEPIGALSTKFAYDIPFFLTSYYFHPTSLGLHHHSLEPEETLNFKRHFDEDALSEQALIFTSQFLLQSAYRIGIYWGIDVDDFIAKLWNRYLDPLRKGEES